MWWWSKRATVARWLCSSCGAPMVRVHLQPARFAALLSLFTHQPFNSLKIGARSCTTGLWWLELSLWSTPPSSGRSLVRCPARSVARAPEPAIIATIRKRMLSLLHTVLAYTYTHTHAIPDGQIGSDDEYKRMEDVYKRFHGVAGQAHNSILVGVVCAHKIDLATVRSTARCTRGPRTRADNPRTITERSRKGGTAGGGQPQTARGRAHGVRLVQLGPTLHARHFGGGSRQLPHCRRAVRHQAQAHQAVATILIKLEQGRAAEKTKSQRPASAKDGREHGKRSSEESTNLDPRRLGLEACRCTYSLTIATHFLIPPPR